MKTSTAFTYSTIVVLALFISIGLMFYFMMELEQERMQRQLETQREEQKHRGLFTRDALLIYLHENDCELTEEDVDFGRIIEIEDSLMLKTKPS